MMADGGKQDDHVMYATGKNRPQENPEKARSPSVLSGQRGADQGPCARDGREVVTENHPFVRGNVVFPVIAGNGRSNVAVV